MVDCLLLPCITLLQAKFWLLYTSMLVSAHSCIGFKFAAHHLPHDSSNICTYLFWTCDPFWSSWNIAELSWKSDRCSCFHLFSYNLHCLLDIPDCLSGGSGAFSVQVSCHCTRRSVCHHLILELCTTRKTVRNIAAITKAWSRPVWPQARPWLSFHWTCIRRNTAAYSFICLLLASKNLRYIYIYIYISM